MIVSAASPARRRPTATLALAFAVACGVTSLCAAQQPPANPAVAWNAILIDTVVATNTPNAVSPRLAAIVHLAMFDAYNGVTADQRTIRVDRRAPEGADARTAVIAAGHAALVGLFPARKAVIDAALAASLGELAGADPARVSRGLEYGRSVAQEVLAWRAGDGFSETLPAFTGGNATGQWRPTPPAATPMSVLTLGGTLPFAVESARQFRPGAPRGLTSRIYAEDIEAVSRLGRKTGSARTEDQTLLATIWEGNAMVHWNQAANQGARARGLDFGGSVRLFAVLNMAMADTSITTWAAKRYYGGDPAAATWRPVTAIPLAETDGNPDTAAEAGWVPLINTPSHPEYPAGHPSLNGAGATVLGAEFGDALTFTITTPDLPNRTYASIRRAREDGNNARVWGGMHYPSSVVASDALGAAVAEHVMAKVPRARRQ